MKHGARSSAAKPLTGILLLSLLAALCIMAGQWQLGRGHQRDALHAAIMEGRQAPTQLLDAGHRTGPEWAPATVSGHWLDNLTVLLENRNLQGRAGMWVGTPLELAGSPGIAILVLRGWLPRPIPPAHLPDLQAAKGEQTIHGTIRHEIPQLLNLPGLGTGQAGHLPAGWPTTASAMPRLQNLTPNELAIATDLDFLPVILLQAPTEDAGLIQQWPDPPDDSNVNYNYALQWFSFAAIALGAALFMSWRLWRQLRTDRSST